MNNHEAGRGTLCRKDLELIRNWVRDQNFTLAVESLNTVAGWTAMENIGRRYQHFFPSVLSVYSRERFFFRHADTQRSQASLRAFADGLFGANSWPGKYLRKLCSFLLI